MPTQSKTDDGLNKRSLPFRALRCSILGALFFLTLMSWEMYHSQRNVNQALEFNNGVEELWTSILSLNEQMSASVRMAATTDDQMWQNKYESLETRLTGAIELARSKTTTAETSRELTETYEQAVRAVIALEHEALDLVTQDRHDEALALLSSSQYFAQRQAYTNQFGSLAMQLINEAHQEIRMESERTGTRSMMLLIAVLGMGVGWLLILHRMERWRSALAQSVDELQGANASLDDSRRAAEAATAAKSEFLANMSHEIRTPMTAILGFTDALLDPALVESEKNDAIMTIRRNGEHLLGIINDILDISKIEAGKMTVEEIECSPCELIADVVELMQARAETKSLTLDVEFETPMPATIHSDPMRLRQILINLVGNAVKFTEAGGVQIKTRLIDDDVVPTLEFDITDSGIGMSDEQAKRIFHAFTQGDGSMTRQYGGTGLGLAICRRFASMLGGDIRLLFAEPDVGTSFRVTVGCGDLTYTKMIPDPEKQMKSSMKAHHTNRTFEGQPLEGLRILLAEDGIDNQRLIAHILRKAGAAVTVVDNGRLAVDAVLASNAADMYHVVLTDMQMPVMDGYETSRLLRRYGFLRPIIALTAHAMPADRQKCLEAGCSEYLSKPVNREQLIECIRRSSTSNARIEKTGDESLGRVA